MIVKMCPVLLLVLSALVAKANTPSARVGEQSKQECTFAEYPQDDTTGIWLTSKPVRGSGGHISSVKGDVHRSLIIILFLAFRYICIRYLLGKIGGVRWIQSSTGSVHRCRCTVCVYVRTRVVLVLLLPF